MTQKPKFIQQFDTTFKCPECGLSKPAISSTFSIIKTLKDIHDSVPEKSWDIKFRLKQLIDELKK